MNAPIPARAWSDNSLIPTRNNAGLILEKLSGRFEVNEARHLVPRSLPLLGSACTPHNDINAVFQSFKIFPEEK